jgi:hypothetical protein
MPTRQLSAGPQNQPKNGVRMGRGPFAVVVGPHILAPRTTTKTICLLVVFGEGLNRFHVTVMGGCGDGSLQQLESYGELHIINGAYHILSLTTSWHGPS